MDNTETTSTQQDTETRILLAAENEFITKGFSGARTSSIAAAAGVTHAMLHYYFRTKEKLFERIISEKMGMLKDGLLPVVLKTDCTLEEYIYGIIDQHLTFIAHNPMLPGFLIRELNSGSAQATAILDVMRRFAPMLMKGFGDKIHKAVEEGICRPVDIKMLVIDLVSLNIFPYIAAPLLNAALGNCMANAEEFLAAKKKENFEIIMSRLKPLS